MERGQGKIEVIACRDEILDLLCKGYPVIQIRKILVAKGAITASRQQFERWVNKLIRPAMSERFAKAEANAKPLPKPSAPTSNLTPHHFPQPIRFDPGRKIDWE